MQLDVHNSAAAFRQAALPLLLEREAENNLLISVLLAWEADDARVVSMAGMAHGDTPNGRRVSAVYTRPEARRKGYASALVTTVSQTILDAGKRFCFIFTDTANPTSNGIYEAIGCELICELQQCAFVAPAPEAANTNGGRPA